MTDSPDSNYWVNHASSHFNQEHSSNNHISSINTDTMRKRENDFPQFVHGENFEVVDLLCCPSSTVRQIQQAALVDMLLIAPEGKSYPTFKITVNGDAISNNADATRDAEGDNSGACPDPFKTVLLQGKACWEQPMLQSERRPMQPPRQR